MGKIKQGILGGFSGRVGGVVGSSWKGIDVVKSRPLSVANPKTSGQVAQRGAFSQVVAFAAAILAAVIKPLWDRFQIQKSGYNAFVSTNIPFFSTSGLDTPASLVISKGKMESTAIASVTATAGSPTVQINWVDDSGSGYKGATDEAYAVVYNETTGEVVGGTDGNERADEYVTVTLSANLASADDLHCYLAFKRKDGTVVSNTSYSNKVVS